MWFGAPAFTVTRAVGDVIIHGMKFNTQQGWVPSLHMFTSVNSKEVSLPCGHCNDRKRFLSIESDGHDFLVVACNMCHDIKLLQLQV